MDIVMKFDKVDEYINEGEYEKAFQLLDNIINEKSSTNEQVAEAFNLKGVIVSGFAPYLGGKDDTGLNFYKRAIEKNGNCLGALLNILSGYSFDEFNTPSMHTDRQSFINAFETLSDLPKSYLDKTQLDMLNTFNTRYIEEKKKAENNV